MNSRANRKRRFNSCQRVALFLAAGGVCALCNAQLAPAWHADHIRAFSRDGATDTANGQALCPRCNLHKGARDAAASSHGGSPRVNSPRGDPPDVTPAASGADGE